MQTGDQNSTVALQVQGELRLALSAHVARRKDPFELHTLENDRHT